MKKSIILFFVLGFVLSLCTLQADEVEKKLSSALDYYKNGKSADTVREISDVLMILHNKKEFAIKNLFLCEFINGFGDYVKRESNTLKASDTFQLYLEVEGYGVEKQENNYGFWLSKDMILLDEKGKEVFQKSDYREYKKSFASPIIPFFMQSAIKNLPPGKYKLDLTVKDHIKKVFASASLSFEVEK